MKKYIVGTSFAIFILLVGLVVGRESVTAQSAPKLSLGDPLPQNLFMELARVINPTVVNISTSAMPRGGQRRGQDPFYDLFEQFGFPPGQGPGGPQGQQPRGGRQPMQSLGTGFVIREDGLILTNNHVIEGADVIQVQLEDDNDQVFEATLVGRDSRTDLALIKISPKKKLQAAVLGSSANLKVGEWVAAFGNPFGHGHTMTKGIVSAIGRQITEINRFPFIQTDASINPGNSGGPLVNTKGEVIGVNSAIDARAQGIGFAIPVDNVKSIIQKLEKEGVIKRGFIGVYLANVDQEAAQELGLKTTRGALITQVMRGGPADKAGMKPYDFVTSANKIKVNDVGGLINAISDSAAGESVTIEAIREGKTREFKVMIDANPEDNRAAIGPTKKYAGQKAPFDLGFSVMDYTKQVAQEIGLPELREPRPIVIDVSRGSKASQGGLLPGDIVLDVNKQNTPNAKAVLKALKRTGNNMLRVLRGNTAQIIILR